MNRFEATVEKIRYALIDALGRADWSLVETTHNVEYSEKLTVGKYELRLPDQDAPKERRWDMTARAYREFPVPVASFELHPMINCCGICVSSRAYVHPDYRGKGLNTLLNQLRINIARANDYSMLLCTDDVNNVAQQKTLLKNGWREICRFVNRRTTHTVAISIVNL